MKTTAAIHVAKKQLNLDDDTYRAICLRVTGKHSSAAMSEGERLRLIDEFRRQGFKTTSKGGRKRLEGKFAGKLQALWIAGWNLGVFHNRADEALIKFVQGQTGLDDVRFVHHASDARSAIEGLKKWIERKVGPVWTDTPATWSDGRKVAATQWSLLSQAGKLPEAGSLCRYVENHIDFQEGDFDLDKLTAKDWQTVMNSLGLEIRKVAQA